MSIPAPSPSRHPSPSRRKSASHAIFVKRLQGAIIVSVITATSIFSYLGKFETAVGMLFGTLAGYIFGRK
jgi:uncharacterized membrane protein required for colicin V production